MKFRFWSALVFFIGSYFPLSMIWLLQNISIEEFPLPDISLKPFSASWGVSASLNNATLTITIFAITLLCLAVSLYFLNSISLKHDIVIRKAKPIPSEMINYVLPYVVSFMSLEHQQEGKFLGVMIFMGWLFWISYKSDQLFMNPVFITFGWMPYEVEYNHAGSGQVFEGRALSRCELQVGSSARMLEISGIMKIENKE